MLIKRKTLENFCSLFDKLKNKTFNIETQYKFLVLNKTMREEEALRTEQISLLIQKYADRDEDEKIITTEDGGIKIKQNLMEECTKSMEEINTMEITVPDTYFTFDELVDLELTLEELDLMEPFIKP